MDLSDGLYAAVFSDLSRKGIASAKIPKQNGDVSA